MIDYNDLCKMYSTLKGKEKQKVEKQLVDMAIQENQDICTFLKQSKKHGSNILKFNIEPKTWR